VLHSFAGGSDGANPLAAPVLDQAGNLYGATSAGGSNYFGTLYKIDTTGNESVLYSFTGGTDGAYPYSHLLVDTSGNLFGTASQGGCCGQGSIFEFSNGTLTALYGFSAAPNGTNPDGQIPMGGLIRDSAGNFYGTATEAGPDGWGTVFELQVSGKLGDAQAPEVPNTSSTPSAKLVPMGSEDAPANTLQLEPICNPTISAPVEVATSHQRYVAGTKARPPLMDSCLHSKPTAAICFSALTPAFTSVNSGTATHSATTTPGPSSELSAHWTIRSARRPLWT
jgi:uncharacterized repeat protein (TIGR03803 family)